MLARKYDSKALRRTFVAACTVSALLVPFWASAQSEASYPTKPIRLVVPFPAGGYSDSLARIIATDMGKSFGQPVVVENRPGAGGNIGSDVIAKSPPDGYTLVMGTIGTHAINQSLYKRMPYDNIKDFAPVAFVADAETVLVVNPTVPAKTVKEMIALAKAKPGDLTYASGGPGTTSHLAGELFEVATGTAIVHIPYKGNVPALTDLVAGQVTMSFATLQPALPFIKVGRIVPLATLGATRTTALPNVPTLRELGLKDFEVRNWTGLLAAGGTPPAITKKLADEVDKVMTKPDVQAMLAAQGLSYTKMGPDQFASFIKQEAVKWSAVVKSASVKLD